VTGRVEIVAPDPRWATIAGAEASALRRVLDAEVHHVGSTSVPGLPAKPIVDLLPVVADLAEVDAARPALEGLGLAWRGEYGIAGRRYLVRQEAGRSVLHVHVFAAGHPEIARHLAFRDALRARPELAAAYAALKRELVARFAGAREAYQDGKSGFIEEVLCQAMDAAYRGP
jgi:GrpB-like predicted nucleotidyltransferase (UPF0157 family)